MRDEERKDSDTQLPVRASFAPNDRLSLSLSLHQRRQPTQRSLAREHRRPQLQPKLTWDAFHFSLSHSLSLSLSLHRDTQISRLHGSASASLD